VYVVRWLVGWSVTHQRVCLPQNDLYMYDWDKNSCTHLDMGFGIPRSNWFTTGSTIIGPEWLYRNDMFYEVRCCLLRLALAFPHSLESRTQTVQVSKPAPYSPFNYYALTSDGTPFRLEAPGPTGSIFVNEFKNFTAKAPNPALFNLPASPVCTTGSMKEVEHQHWFSIRFAHLLRKEHHARTN